MNESTFPIRPRFSCALLLLFVCLPCPAGISQVPANGQELQGKGAGRISERIRALLVEYFDASGATRKSRLEALLREGEPAHRALVSELSSGDRKHRKLAAFALGQCGAAVVPLLIETLKKQDPELTKTVAMAFRRIGDAALPALMDALGKVETRQWAGLVLKRYGEKARVLLLERLKNGSVMQQSGAAWLLGELRAEGALASLRDASKSSDGTVRRYAIFAIARIAKPSTMPLVLDALDDQRQDVRMEAAKGLVRYGKLALPALRRLETEGSIVAQAALPIAYAGFGEPGLSGIRRIARGGGRIARLVACRSLVQLPSTLDEKVDALLIELLGREDLEMIAAACETVRKRKRANKALTALIARSVENPQFMPLGMICEALKALHSKEGAVCLAQSLLGATPQRFGDSAREEALRSHGPLMVPAIQAVMTADVPDLAKRHFARCLGAGGPKASQLLLELAGSKDRVTAGFAVRGLGELGDAARVQVLEAIVSPKADIRRGAVRAIADLSIPLGDWTPKLLALARSKSEPKPYGVLRALRSPLVPAGPAIPILQSYLVAKDEKLKRSALASLASYGAVAIPALAALRQDESKATRRALVKALKRVAGREAENLLRLLLEDHEYKVRKDAVLALGQRVVEEDRTKEAIFARLGDKSGSVRRAACSSLAALGKASLPYLRRALRHETWFVRYQGVEAAGLLGETARPLLPALEALAKDSNEMVRSSARWVLGRLGKD